MKRNLIIIAAIFIGTIVLMLLGNIIIIGEKLSQLTHLWWAEWVFYGLLAIVGFWLVLLPMIRLHSAPEFPVLTLSPDMQGQLTPQSRAALQELGHRLADNVEHLPKAKRAEHARQLRHDVDRYIDDESLRRTVQAELDTRLQLVKSHVHEWGKTVFMITALSQNSKVDAIASMVINMRMISDVIRCSGFRPSHSQLFKQYVRILATSLFSYYLQGAVDGAVDDIDITFGDGAADAATTADGMTEAEFINSIPGIHIAGFIPSSLLDGAINTLLTLRIGYVTRSYLEHGAEALAGRAGMSVRRHAMIDALKEVATISAEATKQGVSAAAGKVADFFRTTPSPSPTPVSPSPTP